MHELYDERDETCLSLAYPVWSVWCYIMYNYIMPTMVPHDQEECVSSLLVISHI